MLMNAGGRHVDLAFSSHSFFRGGHAQTLAGLYLPSQTPDYSAIQHEVRLPDGDAIVLHDDQPVGWTPGSRVALLIHGLAGCHGSGYMRRVASKLNRLGVRTFRLDMRGMGAAAGRARGLAHAGRHADAHAALTTIGELCPRSPIVMIGFSLGGNITLNCLALESPLPAHVERAIVVSPPTDLQECCDQLRHGVRRAYDRYLLRLLCSAWLRAGGKLPARRPRSLFEFDDLITAPHSGFRNAEDYYAQSSSGPRMSGISTPVRILAAADDPMVPVRSIRKFPRSKSVELCVTATGGHLGFIGRRKEVPDRRWMDHLILRWLGPWESVHDPLSDPCFGHEPD